MSRTPRGLALVLASALALAMPALTGSVALAAAPPVGAQPISGPISGPAGHSAAVPRAASSTGSIPAVDELSACLTAQAKGDVLVLMDESQSLQTTDPNSDRVVAAQRLVERLGAAADEGNWKLSVSVVGFSAGLDPVVDWTALTRSSAAAVNARLASFRTKDDGLDTDYWSALDGVRQRLRQRARAATGQPCQAVVWITDGENSIEARTTPDQQRRYGFFKPFAPKIRLTTKPAAAKVEQLGAASVCRAGGLADQLHTAGVRIFAIGLERTPSAGAFDLLRGIATGSDTANGPCGASGGPKTGYFAPVSDLDDLLFVLEQIPDGGVVVPGGVCQGKAGPACTRLFVLDDSVRSVRLLAGAKVKGIVVQLQGPAGGPGLSLSAKARPSGTASLGGVPVTWTWLTPTTVSATFAKTAGRPWVGAWSIAFVDPTGKSKGARSRSVLTIKGDLVPAAPGLPATELRTGQAIDGVRFAVVRPGSSAPVPVRGTATLDATLVRDGQPAKELFTGLDVASSEGTHALDLTGVPPGKARVRLRLHVTTAAAQSPTGAPIAGTALEDETADVPVTVQPPTGDYPTVADSLDFGLADGTTSLSAGLPVTGPGCVWLDSTNVATQPDETTVRVSAPSAGTQGSCLKLGAGQQARLPLTLVLSRPASGTSSGTLQIGTTPANGGPVVKIPVSFSADSTLPANTLRRILVLLLLLVLGIAVPVAVAYAAAWFGARVPKALLRVALLPVRVEDSRVLRDGRPFWVTGDDLSWVEPARGQARHLPLGGTGLTVHARIGLDLTRPVRYDVEGGGVDTLAPTVRPPGRRRPNWVAVLPESVHNDWVAVLRAPDDVAVAVMFDNRADQAVWARVADDVQARLPELLRRYRGEAGPGAAAGPPVTTQGGPGAGGAGPGAGGWFGAGSGGSSGPSTAVAPPPSSSSPSSSSTSWFDEP